MLQRMRHWKMKYRNTVPWNYEVFKFEQEIVFTDKKYRKWNKIF